MSVSAASLSAGAILVAIDTEAASGAARRVRLASTRPTGFSARLFAGRSPAEVPGLVARMHALCGRSHLVAAEIAIVAAMGRDSEPVIAERFEGLVAERLGEHLRSTVTNDIGRGATLDREVLADVRSILASCRTLVAGSEPQRRFEAAKAIEGIGTALDRLGLAIDRRGRVTTSRGGWGEAMLASVGSACGDRFAVCDRLGRDDDAAVIAALARDPEGFSAAPHLADRRPETGPAARGASGAASAGGIERMTARLGEIAEAAELLGASPADRARVSAAWATGDRVEYHTGYAAVESPRGRLHHLVRLDDAGRIAAYAILAPTEWNFHADGPLVRTLMLNHFPSDAEGRARAERIAGLFDPCVGFEVAITEVGDA